MTLEEISKELRRMLERVERFDACQKEAHHAFFMLMHDSTRELSIRKKILSERLNDVLSNLENI